ncbi:Predicted arabinose efflux permease, MFS family [Brachymonas denitrificans DSM 15123]|uniref:Predicted arabinose efflux permease, MFS family n=2 Tax=Brachymonas denitrificans TaxID=28220 RepID=A0A1H8EBY9_9BURK|nr:Predicted arabinose efflux permease, MFS family [Brachymonas denitrificans DSM 15123]
MGFASLFMDISSELIHSLLPLFMVGTLGASMVAVGLVEGIAEATASITKVFSGALSDYLGKRKWLMVLGYGMAALTKPIFPLAHSMGWVMAARFIDRIGKGIRGAPRDALVADIAPPHMRGAAYGLRQSLDSVGALAGPLLAVLLMLWLADNLRLAMWFSVIPAVICVVLLAIWVRDPEKPAGEARANGKRLHWSSVKELPLQYWLIVLIGAVFTLARFSEAFLVLRAQSMGVAMALVPIVMVVMNIVYAAGAYPAGAASDRMQPRTLMLLGLALLVAADVVLALAPNVWMVYVGSALWGLHMAVTQGLLSKLVADRAPQSLLGTAFGMFNLVSGVAMLAASLIAGWLWDAHGPSLTFWAGAGFAGVTALALLLAPGTRGQPAA